MSELPVSDEPYIPTVPSKRKMYFEWNWPTMWSWKAGCNILNFSVEVHWKGDHAPSFYCCWVLCNLKVLDFSWYNIYHEDDD